MSPVLLLLSICLVAVAKGETIPCNGRGACKCKPGKKGETCTLKCQGKDKCKDRTLKCRAGDPCIIQCIGESVCGDATIDGSQATDVSVFCDGKDACKGDTKIKGGTGDMKMECDGSTSCEDASLSCPRVSSFECNGKCPRGNAWKDCAAKKARDDSKGSGGDSGQRSRDNGKESNDNSGRRSRDNGKESNDNSGRRSRDNGKESNNNSGDKSKSDSRPKRPTQRPTRKPTKKPTPKPTKIPTLMPTSKPTPMPTSMPTNKPTPMPTTAPTRITVQCADGDTCTVQGAYENEMVTLDVEVPKDSTVVFDATQSSGGWRRSKVNLEVRLPGGEVVADGDVRDLYAEKFLVLGIEDGPPGKYELMFYVDSSDPQNMGDYVVDIMIEKEPVFSTSEEIEVTDPEVKFIGHDPDFLLKECEGDCDNDDDCAGDLVCFEDPFNYALGGIPPGCRGKIPRRHAARDFCYDPNTPTSTTTMPGRLNAHFVDPEPRDALKSRFKGPEEKPVYEPNPPETDVWTIELDGKALLVLLFGVLDLAMICWMCYGVNCGQRSAKKYQPVYGVGSGTENEEML